ncbi:MAG: PilZ domain-containing protein [Candidatus Hydrogenedentota bacterium]
MYPIAALIEFPEPSAMALWGLAIAVLLLIAIFYGNVYFKRTTQTRNLERVQSNAIDDIYEDKKLSDEEIRLMNEVLDRHVQDNPLRSVTTRDGFGECVRREIDRVNEFGAPGDVQILGVKLRDIRTALGLDYVPIGKPIYSSRELHIGQIISITPKEETNAKKTRMELRNIDEAYLYLSPEKRGAPLKFVDGTQVQCELWRDEDGCYTFDSRIVYYGTEHAEWRLAHNAAKMARTQAREHFRMPFQQTATIGILNASKDEDITYLSQSRDVAQLRGKITSLSAGGCAIVFQQPIARNILLRVEIELPDHPPISVVAKIVATSNISGGRCLIRTRFLDISEEERDLISRHLLHKQQENLATKLP